MTESRSSDRKLKPLPPDPARHQDSAIARGGALRDFRTDRFGSCQIDDKLEFGRLLDPDIAGLRPAQNLVDDGAPEQARVIQPVATVDRIWQILPQDDAGERLQTGTLPNSSENR